jgi:hypothetical protein
LPNEAETIPFPKEETTPPVTKIYFVLATTFVFYFYEVTKILFFRRIGKNPKGIVGPRHENDTACGPNVTSGRRQALFGKPEGVSKSIAPFLQEVRA